MKKLLFVAATLGLLTCSAESYLYWMFNNDSIDAHWTSYLTSGQAQVAVYGASDTKLKNRLAILTLADWDGGDLGTKAPMQSVYNEGAAGTGWYATLGTYASSEYSYAVELLADGTTTEVKGKSNPIAYQVAESLGYLSDSPMSPADAAWQAAFAIPEPTSGLLVLVGGALLALRRRRRIAA